MNQFSTNDKNKGMCCAQKGNKYCFKYFTLFSISQPNFGNLTQR